MKKQTLIKMNKTLKNIITLRRQPNKDTLIAFILGFSVIILSILLLLFTDDTFSSRIGFFIIRQLIMVFSIGFAFPIYYTKVIKGQKYSELGIKKEKWLLSIVLNVIFTIILLWQFIFFTDERGSALLTYEAIGPIFYIMVVGIFEIIFFYGFLRQKFEEAFGIIPGILLAAGFYSFHHAGFQPEFLKLFFVGIMYASAFRITRNVLIIYPFFWGLGACWDVLISFDAMEILKDSWIWGIIVLGLMVTFIICLRIKLTLEEKRK